MRKRKEPFRIVIIVGMFHRRHANKMLAVALAMAKKLGLKVVLVIKVAGSYEIPIRLRALLHSPRIDGAVVISIIEQGETDHGAIMADHVEERLGQIELETMKPIGRAIISGASPEQIMARLVGYAERGVIAPASQCEFFSQPEMAELRSLVLAKKLVKEAA